MSTRADNIRAFGVDLAGSLSGSLSVAAKLVGIQWPADAPAQTAATDTVTVGRHAKGLASLIGKYDNDPSWGDFSAFLEQYRREIDELSRD